MKKAVLSAPFEIQIQDCAMPEVGPEQVLLRVRRLGICGSDLQMYHGLHRYMTFPVVPGHEVGAEVVKLGASITEFQVGDKVTVEPQVFCGLCEPCRRGRFNVCEQLRVKGVHLDGFAAEYAAVEPKYLHRCPANMDYDSIALLEPLAVGVGAVRRSRFQGANITVIGAGTIGNLTAQAAMALGAANVLVTDVVDSKLAFARSCGIPNCANLKELSLAQAIEEAFGQRRSDVIIDTAATKTVFAQALDASRPSSELVITGNYKQPVELDVTRIQRREVSIIGHMMYVREDFQLAIQMVAERKVKLDGLVTRHFPLKDFGKAMEFADADPAGVMKLMLDVDGGDRT